MRKHAASGRDGMSRPVRLIICTERGPIECAVTSDITVDDHYEVPEPGTEVSIILPSSQHCPLKVGYVVLACIPCSDRLEVIVFGDQFTVQRLKREGWSVVADFHKNRPYP